MPHYVDGMVVNQAQIVRIHAKFAHVLDELGALAGSFGPGSKLGRREAVAMRETALVAYGRFNERLDLLAVETAGTAREAVKEVLKGTRQRQDTGLKPSLRNKIRARPTKVLGPVATGSVGVGDIDVLNQAVNPFNPAAGTYWRAQEYGSAHNMGRVIRGYFFGPGGSGTPSPPQSVYAGGGGPHPVFIAGGLGSKGGFGGYGTINFEIKPRHFISRGTRVAYSAWRIGLRQVERQTERDLSKLAAELIASNARVPTRHRRR